MPHEPHGGAKPQGWALAELNVATAKHAMGSPGMADFENALDEINALAEASDGFIWRLKDDSGNATDLRGPLGDDILVNMSVWRDVESLKAYVYRSAHTPFLGRRKEWFEMPAEAHMVLWWVSAGHRPTLEEAAERLRLLRTLGPGPRAFTFKRVFDPAGVSVG